MKPQLPMYKSRFRSGGALISAIDICNGCAPDFLADPERYMQIHPLVSPFQNSKFETFLWGELFSASCDLHGLTYMLDLYKRWPSRIDSFQREYFEDTFAGVQHELVSFPYPTTTGGVKSTIFYRQHCWRIAALLYFNVALRTWDPASGMIRMMVEQLILALRKSDIWSMWSPFSDILLWILFIGSCGAWSNIERDWLLLELRTIVRILNLRSLEEFETLLKSFLYRESTYHEPLCYIWDELHNAIS